jgi:hypothetical protein
MIFYLFVVKIEIIPTIITHVANPYHACID